MIFVFLIVRLLDITLFFLFSFLFHFVNTIRRTLLLVEVHVRYFLIFL